MKRFFIILALLFLSLGAWAQASGTGTVKRAGSRIKIDGVKLSPEAQAALLADIGGTDYNAPWNKAVKGRKAGMALTIGGGVVTVGGGAVLLLGVTTSVLGAALGATFGSIGGEESAQAAAQQGAAAGQPYTTAGLITSGIGIAALGVGIPLLAVNNKRLNGIVRTCNADRPAVQVSLGPTPGGIGLSIQF